jgi:ectoine hydroxylase-related dioxygenase (phytanoyl-CoA dioxygenase family)
MNNQLSKKNYSFDKKKYSIINFSENTKTFFNEYGFCLIENVIPENKILNIKDEVISATIEINKNIKKYKEEYEKGKSDSELLSNKDLELRLGRYKGRPPKPVNDIYWMSNFSNYLTDNYVVSFAKKILDDHLRISQLHPKSLPSQKKSSVNVGVDMFGLPRLFMGNKNTREWHTDWPHDPWAYGGDNEKENVGCIRHPFPDITMSLVMVWFLTDVDKSTSGTWIVPKSHKFAENPRAAKDNVSPVSPIPGEIQLEAKAGSVAILDTRLWHSAPINLSGQERVSVVNRWNPWWLSTDEFAPNSRFNNVCRPLSLDDFNKLPKKLKPLMKHLCSEVTDTIQKPLIDRSKLAVDSSIKKYQDLEKNPDIVLKKNKNLFKVIKK